MMRILSRDAFAQVLVEARRRTRTLDPSRWPLLGQIEAQLQFIAEQTKQGRVPHEEDRMRTTLGPLAARNLEDIDPEYADQLEEIDYTFRRYPQLPHGPSVRRRGVLQVWSGRETYRKLVLDLGVPRTVGSAQADFVVHGDTAGSPHFQIVWDGVSAHVQAEGTHRLAINGVATWYGEMANRGWMTAVRTAYRFLVEDHTPPPEPIDAAAAALDALTELARRCGSGNLYAIIDAARSERALQLVEESIDPYASLYDGEQGRAFDDIAPYLVHLQPSSGLLRRLVTEGWGDAWGVYVESSAGFEKVRRHFRQFLKVEVEGEAKPRFFRFYDPRVLCTFAEVMTPEQRSELRRAVDAVLFERATHGLRMGVIE
ncbi:immunity protein Tsi6 family protein [Nannocystis bainbridge]|uniref:Immunity protein Tsi6 family protein n=1 Tax=Nannocystis bainbridge TaxID=2995303 RepID=A0ABT5DW95_9BACT|nr:immunity protein Tsi6 family protein [Nannocystis bainbridge]MDC0716687.1 immunity protein Tsi6 family protein [Nannocystis bainbridge]